MQDRTRQVHASLTSGSGSHPTLFPYILALLSTCGSVVCLRDDDLLVLRTIDYPATLHVPVL